MKNESLSNKPTGYRVPGTKYAPLRQWTPEQRARQAKRIRSYKPWLRSTGPKTVEGKQKCSRNAHKHGGYSAETRAEIREMRAFLALNRKYLEIAGQYIRKMRQEEKTMQTLARTKAFKKDDAPKKPRHPIPVTGSPPVAQDAAARCGMEASTRVTA